MEAPKNSMAWLPIIIPAVTSFMVMYYGANMEEKKQTDEKLLQEVQSINKELHETNVTFKGIQVEVQHLSEGQKKMEKRKIFFLFGNIWSIKGKKNVLVSKLTFISVMPVLFAIVGGVLTFFINSVWGISFLLCAVYASRHFQYVTSITKTLDKNYVDLINKISIILCICLMLILVYWLNPYTKPIEIYN